MPVVVCNADFRATALKSLENKDRRIARIFRFTHIRFTDRVFQAERGEGFYEKMYAFSGVDAVRDGGERHADFCPDDGKAHHFGSRPD